MKKSVSPPLDALCSRCMRKCDIEKVKAIRTRKSVGDKQKLGVLRFEPGSSQFEPEPCSLHFWLVLVRSTKEGCFYYVGRQMVPWGSSTWPWPPGTRQSQADLCVTAFPWGTDSSQFSRTLPQHLLMAHSMVHPMLTNLRRSLPRHISFFTALTAH